MRLAAPKPVSYHIGSDFVLIGRRARHSGGLREKIDLPATDWIGCAGPRPQGCRLRGTLSEQVSAVAQRDRLCEALRFVSRGDTLVACNEPDRLARSTTDLLRIVDDLDHRGVGLIMLSMGRQRIDTRSPTGKLMITMLAAIAEFERGLLLERQREGVAKAKQEGKYKGRQPIARAKAAEVIKFDAEGLQRAEIARRTGIGVASLYRVLADAKKPHASRTIPV